MAFKVIDPTVERVWTHPADPEVKIRFKLDPDHQHALAVEHSQAMREYRELKSQLETKEGREAAVLDPRYRGLMEASTAFLQDVIVSWEGFQDAATGQAVVYRPELVPAMAPYLSEFAEHVAKLASEHYDRANAIARRESGN